MRLLLLLPAVLLFAAACGGEAKTTEPAGAPATSGSGSSAATAAATKAVGAPAASSGPLDACKLVSADDIGRATSLTGVSEIAGSPGDPSFCMYGTGAGVQAASLTYVRNGAARDFDALAAGTQSVSGLGEKAYWNAGLKTLSVLKGGTMLQISPAGGLSDAEVPAARRLDMAKAIATIAVAKQ